MKTKRILMIAPASIPVTGAEAICNVKLIKVLADNGYKIDLVSKKMKYTHYPETTLKELNINLDSIHTIEVDNKITLKVIWQHICTFFVFGTVFKGAHWAYCTLKTVKALCEQNKYDAVITKNSPSELLGFYLKKKYSFKWIATWNDPYPTQKYPSPYGDGINAKLFFLERPILKKMELADYHIFPNSRIKDYMSMYLNIKKDKTKIIPHVVLKKVVRKYKEEKKLKLVHMGNILPPRDAKPFLYSLSKFVRVHPTADIEVAFIGQTPVEVQKYIEEQDLKKYVMVLPPVKYEKSQEILQEYSMQLIIEAPCNVGIFLPTKVSDSMQLSKPIFAISPEIGVLNDLYQRGQISYFSTITNPKSIYNTIEQIYYDFLNNGIKTPKIDKSFLPSSIIKQYDEII